MKRFFIITLIVIFSFIILGVIGVFSISKVRGFLYKEIGYQFIADQVVGDEKDEEKITLLLFSYIHTNLNVVRAKVIDQDSWNDLVRGIAWCDQQSWAFATILSKKNIHARIVMLKDKDGISPHTVAEVFLRGKWRVFDPLNGLVFRKPDDGSLATLEDISNDPSIISQHPKVKLLQEEARKNFLDRYARIFPIPQAPERWSSLLDKKNQSLPRKAINRVIKLAVDILGRPFVNAYQDLYLLAKAKSFTEPAERLYCRARNHHLYYRTNLAEKTYKQIIQNHPQSRRVEDGQFFLGVLKVDFRDYQNGVNELEEFFEKFPNSKWRNIAHYSLGRAYEGLKDFENARISYNYCRTSLDTDAVWRLSRLPLAQ